MPIDSNFLKNQASYNIKTYLEGLNDLAKNRWIPPSGLRKEIYDLEQNLSHWEFHRLVKQQESQDLSQKLQEAQKPVEKIVEKLVDNPSLVQRMKDLENSNKALMEELNKTKQQQEEEKKTLTEQLNQALHADPSIRVDSSSDYDSYYDSETHKKRPIKVENVLEAIINNPEQMRIVNQLKERLHAYQEESQLEEHKELLFDTVNTEIKNTQLSTEILNSVHHFRQKQQDQQQEK